MIEFLSMIALWCGEPTNVYNPRVVFECRKHIYDCVHQVKPLVLTNPKNDKLIKHCIERYGMMARP